MKVGQQDIRAALLGFLELLESPDQQASTELLELWLGQLAFLQHFAGDFGGDRDVSLQPGYTYSYWRKLIGEKFPGFGYYDIPETIPAQIGDSLDDLADIAEEISRCLQYWESAGAAHALWYFRFSYQAHWGAHLRNLQTYLHHLH